jgi:uncharacterized membrane protein YebE (DUF533 family)
VFFENEFNLINDQEFQVININIINIKMKNLKGDGDVEQEVNKIDQSIKEGINKREMQKVISQFYVHTLALKNIAKTVSKSIKLNSKNFGF